MSLRVERFTFRPPTPDVSASPVLSRTEFYRQEFLKHQRCLDHQREYYSEQAIHGVEHAIRLILSRLDVLCREQDCDRVLSDLLRKFDAVTCLSAWDDRRTH
jgi:hypothetical protein